MAHVSKAQRTYWREGKLLVARHGAVLPPRCVKCDNFTMEPARRRQLHWHPFAWNFLYLLTPVVYRAVASLVQRTMDLSFTICQHCKRKRLVFAVVGIVGMLAALAMCVHFVSNDKPAESILCLLGFVIFFLVMRSGRRQLVPVSIAESVGRFQGCGKAFLASLDDA